jgi:hypothetical protein
MKKIFKTISASLVTALIVFAAILTAVVLLEMFVVKLFPDVDLPIYRSCCVAIFYVLFVIIFWMGIIKFAVSRLSRFLNKSDDNQNGDFAGEYVKNELDETKKELERRLRERYLIELRDFMNAMQTYKFDPFEKVLVRDFRNSEWRAAIFAWHDDREGHYPFRTTDNEGYSFCLPYNYITDRLVNTTLSLEELLELKEKEYQELNKDKAE